jgi:hypothetical protein
VEDSSNGRNLDRGAVMLHKLFHCDKVIQADSLNDLQSQLHQAVYPEGLVHLEFLGEGWYASVTNDDTILILKSGDLWILFLWQDFDPREKLEEILC